MSDRDVLDMDLEENEEKELLGEFFSPKMTFLGQLPASFDVTFSFKSGMNILVFNP